MALDPFLQAGIEAKAGEPRFAALSVDQARASRADARMQTWPKAGPVETRDLEISMSWGACRARLYRPKDAAGDLPLVVFFHGGGFVICDIETHDGLARSLCGAACVAVLSVDYRLAPEHPFPAPLDDAEEAVRWAIEAAPSLSVDAARIVLAGDSAGGYLSLAAALRLAERPAARTLAGLALFYPVVDAPGGTESYRAYAEGYGLTAGDMAWFWDHLGAGVAEPARPAASSRLSALPPTLILTAAYDVLRDEGEDLAARLIAQGIRVTARRCPGMNHNFLAFAKSVAGAEEALLDYRAWMESVLTKST